MENTTVGKIVAKDFRAASIFEKHSIDFCCNGNISLEEACKKNNTSFEQVQKELELLPASDTSEMGAQDTWDLDFLTEYIVQTHHRYVKEAIPVISAHCAKVDKKHGERHPEVVHIHKLFEEIAEELTRHMMKEELVLFPYIKSMVESSQKRTVLQRPHFGTIANPIKSMEAEHQEAGNKVEMIRLASNGFSLPEDACATFGVMYDELKQFEKDLHKHVHLENNILFPKAILLEKELMSSQRAA